MYIVCHLKKAHMASYVGFWPHLEREREAALAAEDREQWYNRSWRIARTRREKGKAYCQL